MTIIRQQGQLAQTDPNDQSTQDLASQQGMPAAPTTPAGAAGIGATPDQAKMAGTGVQKAAVLNTPAKPADSLQNAEALDQTRDKPTDVETAAKDKATQLQTLGSLSVRVQALVQQRLSPAAAAGPELDETKIQALTPDLDKQAQAKTALDAVMKNPGDQQKIADAANLFAANGWGDINNMLPQNYLASAQQAIGDAVKTQGPATLENLQLAPAETQELQAVFGDDSWKHFTPEQLGQKIEDLRQAEFNKVQGLRAQMATATGGQREVLARELKDAASTGQTGVEAGVKNLSQQVQAADTVKIGGEDVKVEDLLKDGAVSDLVGRMINDPALMDKVGKEHPELVAWVKQNQASLADLAKNIGSTTSKVKDTAAATKALATIAPGVTLSDTLMNQLLPGWGKVGTSVPDVSKNGVLAFLKSASGADKSSAANALEQLGMKNPDEMKALANMPSDLVANAWQEGQTLKNDATGMYDKLFPDADHSGFIVDHKMGAAMMKAKPAVDALNAALKQNPKLVDILNDTSGTLTSLIKSGQFTPQDAQILSQHPEAFDAYKKHAVLIASLDKAIAGKDVQSIVDTVFGSHQDLATVQKEYDLAKQMAAIDPTGAGAAKLKAFQANLDLDGSGKIDQGDLAKIVQKLEGQAGVKNQTFDQYLGAFTSGKITNDTDMQKQMGSTAMGVALDPSKDDFFTKMSSALSDGKITNAEMAAMTPEQRAKAWATPSLVSKMSESKTQSAFDKNTADTTANDEGAKMGAQASKIISDNFGGHDPEEILRGLNSKVDGGTYLTPDESNQLVTAYNALKGQMTAAYESKNPIAIAQVNSMLGRAAALLDKNTKVYLAAEDKRKKAEQLASQPKGWVSQYGKRT